MLAALLGSLWLLCSLLSLPDSAEAAPLSPSSGKMWQDITHDRERIMRSQSYKASTQPWVQPPQAKLYSLDTSALRDLLKSAPNKFHVWGRQKLHINLPLQDGSLQRFEVIRTTQVFTGGNSTADFQTFSGRGVNDKSLTAELDMSSAGFHAQIFTATGTCIALALSYCLLRFFSMSNLASYLYVSKYADAICPRTVSLFCAVLLWEK